MHHNEYKLLKQTIIQILLMDGNKLGCKSVNIARFLMKKLVETSQLTYSNLAQSIKCAQEIVILVKEMSQHISLLVRKPKTIPLGYKIAKVSKM